MPRPNDPSNDGGNASVRFRRTEPVDDKARRREEARKRELRSKRIGPIKKRVEELEARIAELEARQRERNDRLCDPSVVLPDAERFALLDALQRDQEALDELTERWTIAQEDLERAEREIAP